MNIHLDTKTTLLCASLRPTALTLLMDSPTCPLAPSVSEVAAVKEEFANGFIGFALATVVYGIGVLQAYLYYRNYPKDRGIVKIMVGMLWFLDTLSTALVAHSLYTLIILNYGNIVADNVIPWSFPAENVALTLVTIITQCFYAWQIWSVSSNIILVGVILLLGWVSFGLGIVLTVHRFRVPFISALTDRIYFVIGGPVQGTACLCDILITVSLIYYLRSRGSQGIRAPRDIIYTLIIYVMCRGIATSFIQLMFLLMNVVVTPDRTFWMPFHLLMSKVYVNSVLASLNARNTVREKDESRPVALSRSLVFNATVNMATSDTGGRDDYLDTHADHSAPHNDNIKLQPMPFEPVDNHLAAQNPDIRAGGPFNIGYRSSC
ncbi:hypothetical protein B0H11DRAFT_2272665 [Mycena galericulata]|nr:hypothetical protein B0H11DRAFT_2272665 [Mycena galericulata]